jgi:hypothetical protein
MLRRITLILTLVGVIGLLTAPAVAAAPPAQPAATDLTDIPVAGTVPGGTFTGLLDITQLERVNGVLQATGTLTGSTNVGGVITPITQTFMDIPLSLVNPGGGVCDILQLDLGPLNLDLLGLVVDLSPISLNMDAVPGAGNLLGNLLCAVAGLLDGPGLGNALNNLLSIINQLLGGLLG